MKRLKASIDTLARDERNETNEKKNNFLKGLTNLDGNAAGKGRLYVLYEHWWGKQTHLRNFHGGVRNCI